MWMVGADAGGEGEHGGMTSATHATSRFSVGLVLVEPGGVLHVSQVLRVWRKLVEDIVPDSFVVDEECSVNGTVLLNQARGSAGNEGLVEGWDVERSPKLLGIEGVREVMNFAYLRHLLQDQYT